MVTNCGARQDLSEQLDFFLSRSDSNLVAIGEIHASRLTELRPVYLVSLSSPFAASNSPPTEPHWKHYSCIPETIAKS